MNKPKNIDVCLDFPVKILCLFTKKLKALYKTSTRGKNKDIQTRE